MMGEDFNIKGRQLAEESMLEGENVQEQFEGQNVQDFKGCVCNQQSSKLPIIKLSFISATTISWLSFVCLSYTCEQEQYIQNLAISYAVYFASYYSVYHTVRFLQK